jgi:alpha-N-arabinofuranosidase
MHWKFTALLLAGLTTASALAAAWAQEITPGRPRPDQVTISIDASKRSPHAVPKTIFGTFLEPIHHAINNGLWAEILRNPSFESGLWDAPHMKDMIAGDSQLVRATQLGLPLPWEPLEVKEGKRYEPRRGEAANSWQSLGIFGVPGKETGIRQRIYLPVHRELHYHGSLFVKHLSGADKISVSIRKRNDDDQVLASAHFAAPASHWHKYSFTLNLPSGALASLQPADFVIEVSGDERALIDQVSLMPDDAIDGLNPAIVSLAKAMHTSVLRFGGNFTSAYHWRDGIGPRDKRISMRNIAWGIPEYNQFGTDEFLHFCKLIGAQPQIALNMGSGTPAEAAAWVRYVDQHWTRHSGNLWELGNELWGTWNLGYPTLKQLPARTLAFSRAVRKADPKARLIATGQDPDHFKTWNAAQLTNPPGTFQFLSTHFVVSLDQVKSKHPTPEATDAAAFALPVGLGRKLEQMQAQINHTKGYRNRAHIAFTEWLFHSCGDRKTPNAPRYDDMGGAVETAGFLNMLLRHSAIVPISDMTGLVEFAGISERRGMVFATPAYYAFRMYSTADPASLVAVKTNSGTYNVHNGVTRVPHIANVPYLDVVAVRDQGGHRLTLFGVNRDLKRDIPADISLAHFSPAPQAHVQVLSAGSISALNDEAHPKRVTPVASTVRLNDSHLRFTFKHASVTRIDIEAK